MPAIDLIASKARIQILRELSRQDRYVRELMDLVGMDGTTAKHHLDTLESAEVISAYEDGRRRYFTLEKEIVFQVTPPPNRRFVLQVRDPS
ncbi:MAG: DNA-binding transcriptional ArsR family regulator [Halobacteriales archaeon]|jgi:DNA-binding transcriptional ArsR family regulator